MPTPRNENRRTVLVTDYAWRSLDREREILGSVGASVLEARTGAEAELVELASEVDGILTCWKHVTAKVIRNAPLCQAICRYGIGLDNIDVQCATEMGILVTNVPGYCVDEVSDHAMAMLLALARGVGFYNQSIKAGSYDLKSGTPLYRIKGKTLGIVGFGRIGRLLYRKALAFQLRVLVYDPYLRPGALEGHDAEQVSFAELLKRSDYISIHVPLSTETRHLFNLSAFQQMKPTAFVINAARGDVIEPKALLQALERRLISGAALDVLAKEPPDTGDTLVGHPRTIVTPHVAFYSEESLIELQETAAKQMADILSGRLPSFVVNPGVLEQSNVRARLGAMRREGS